MKKMGTWNPSKIPCAQCAARESEVGVGSIVDPVHRRFWFQESWEDSAGLFGLLDRGCIMVVRLCLLDLVLGRRRLGRRLILGFGGSGESRSARQHRGSCENQQGFAHWGFSLLDMPFGYPWQRSAR